MSADATVTYVDGACHPNPGPGGYGIVVLGPTGEPALLASGYGGACETNNRMELLGAIEALRLLADEARVELRCDSRYVVDGATRWLAGWKASGWRGGAGDVSNRDLWERLDAALAGRDVAMTWVRGHASDPWNELADELAVDAKLRRGRIGTVAHPVGHVTGAEAERRERADERRRRVEAAREARERATELRAEARRRLAADGDAPPARRVGRRVRPRAGAGGVTGT